MYSYQNRNKISSSEFDYRKSRVIEFIEGLKENIWGRKMLNILFELVNLNLRKNIDYK